MSEEQKNTLEHYLTPEVQERIEYSFLQLQNACHSNAVDKGFWEEDQAVVEVLKSAPRVDAATLAAKAQENITSTKLMLIVSESAEALEGLRQGNPPSDKLHEWGHTQLEEELADIVVRVLDLSGFLGFNLIKAILRKMAVNAKRPYKHGKKF